MKSSLVLCLLALASGAIAQPQSLVDQFERRSIESNGLTVGYRLFVPEGYDPAESYPLVLSLHGAGSGGTDNERHITNHRLATSWADPVRQAEHPAFILAPQLPPGYIWASDAGLQDSPVELAIGDILDALVVEFPIDPDRLYVTGISLGGHGTWDYIVHQPSRFAAAVPMSGRSFTSQADGILHVPIWAFTGELDTVVSPGQTRRVIQRMEDLGRDVLYTDCRRAPGGSRAFDCGEISRDSLATAIDSHADLIYTSDPDAAHGPWAQWYDDPLLANWLFAQTRVDPDAITVTAPEASDRWTGRETVTWSSDRTSADVVEVWLGLDDGGWQALGDAPVADGAYLLDTSAFPDAALAEVRLFVRNDAGRIVGRHTSGRFAIDNAGDAAPSLRLNDEDLRFLTRLRTSDYDLTLTAADPEGDSLAARVFYSVDGGSTFSHIVTEDLASSVAPQIIPLDVGRLSNSPTAHFRVDLDDGTHTVTATTATFVKDSRRDEDAMVEHTVGVAAGTVEVHIVRPEALTSHRYRVTFSVSEAETTYSVTDLDLGTTVLADIALSEGVAESPVFDGLALVVEDLEGGEADLQQTGWTEGDSDLGVAISGGTVRISSHTLDLLATETDYEITMTENVASRSLARYGIPAHDLRFTVTGADGQPREVVFNDLGDGRPGNGDTLYLLEPDADGHLEPAWELRFRTTTETTLPEAGDTFRFVPLRSFGAEDAFEFTTASNVPNEPTPDAATIEFTAYPNPFSDRLTVAYRLDRPGTVTLEVFDVLGRRVAVLADGHVNGGAHQAVWDGAIASGVFIVRLTVDGGTDGPDSSTRRWVVRV